LEVVAPGELDQPLQRLARVAVLEVEVTLGVADMRIALLERGEEQLLFGAVVVIEHPLVRAGPLGDAVDARTAEAVARELDRRRVQNFGTRASGIAAVLHSMPSRR